MKCGVSIPAILVVAGCTLAAQTRVESLRHAASLIEHRDLSGAEALLQGLLKAQPNDALALNLLGVVKLQQQKPDQAEILFHQSIAANSRIVGPHINLARLYGPSRAFNAVAELKEALRLAPANAEAQSSLRSIAKDFALDAMHTGDKEKALAILLRAREALPHDPELLYEAGFVSLESGLYPDAQSFLEQALQARPGYDDAMYALARTYLAENMAARAEQQMREYLRVKPKDATAYYGLGYIMVAEQKLADAKSAFEQSLALQPDQTESLFQLGEIALEQGNEDAARKQFQKVVSHDPRHAGALTELAIFAYRAANYNEAKTALERAIASSPSYQKAHYYYALTLAKTGNKTDADHEFEVSRSLQKTHITNPRLVLTQP